MSIVDRLMELEAGVHYDTFPPANNQPYQVILRDSKVIISAPHGAQTYRNNDQEKWHEEDEYTAGMALLLSELCSVSVIATTWRTRDSDPNEHDEASSAYKQALRSIAGTANTRFLIDLHGASEDSSRLTNVQKIDLGIGRHNEYLPPIVYDSLVAILENHLGNGVADRDGKRGFPAQDKNRISAFAHRTLGLSTVQIEMKPSVRVPLRRTDSSMYRKSPSVHGGPYSAPAQNVLGMVQSLVEFIDYLKTYED